MQRKFRWSIIIILGFKKELTLKSDFDSTKLPTQKHVVKDEFKISAEKTFHVFRTTFDFGELSSQLYEAKDRLSTSDQKSQEEFYRIESEFNSYFYGSEIDSSELALFYVNLAKGHTILGETDRAKDYLSKGLQIQTQIIRRFYTKLLSAQQV